MKPAEIAKALRKLSGRHGVYDVFLDWVSSMALAIANSVDHRPEVHAAREAEYMAIVARHAEDPSIMPAFKALLHDGLVPALEGEPSDVLGEVFHLLELHNKDAGQFFTPWPLALLCAEMTMGAEPLPACGFITSNEPTIGGGAMVLAQAVAMRRRGFDPSRQLHATGQDIDRKVLLMAYVQLSLCGIPAVLYVGDTLRMTMREDWYTPVHVLDGWGPRLAIHRAIDRARALVEALAAEPTAPTAPTAPEPVEQLHLFGGP